MDQGKVKIVVVKHPHCGIPYTFRAPEHDLQVGWFVLCKTKVSDREVGICITPSFEIGEKELELYYGVKSQHLKPVVGLLMPMMFPEEKDE